VLLANVVLLAALLSIMHQVLSLPGIAGILLTVGMAVDANVLIYERIREEIRKGVSPQAAIRAGFEKAFSAIADSNITYALIAGVVLWVFGTGPIPRLRHRAHPRHRHLDVHFAHGQPCAPHPHVRRAAQDRAPVNLTRRLRDRKPQGLQVEFFSHQTSYPFMATRRVWYTLSAVLMIVSLAVVLHAQRQSDHRFHRRRQRRGQVPARRQRR